MNIFLYNPVTSKLDYCNSHYYGLSKYLLKKLQLVMNRAAMLAKGLLLCERITAAPIDLHWLPLMGMNSPQNMS